MGGSRRPRQLTGTIGGGRTTALGLAQAVRNGAGASLDCRQLRDESLKPFSVELRRGLE